MVISFTCDRQVLELTKNEDHFVLIYPKTPTGRVAAKGAVRNWFLDCELDFDRIDAAMFREAIDASRLHATFAHSYERNVRWGRRRP